MRCTEWKCREIGNLLRSTSLIVFAKIDRWVKIESVIAIRVAIEEWGENEMAIEVHCDTCGILTKLGVKLKLVFADLLAKRLTNAI